MNAPGKRLMVIASGGGHWMQMMLLRPAFDGRETTLVTTIPGLAESSGLSGAHIVPDCNRDNPLDVLRCIRSLFSLIRRARPDVIITTGAAPGILGIAIGRLFGARTVWIDSVANSEKLSMSGRMATYLAHDCLTQWQHLEGPRAKFRGRLL